MKPNNLKTISAALFIIVMFFLQACENDDLEPLNALTDIDGNVYRTVQIGEQLWMAENLKVKRYNNGNAISFIIDNELWSNSNEPAFSYYHNSEELKREYGLLYNGFVVDKYWYSICPEGWHIPDYIDWAVLINTVGGNEVAAYELVESGMNHWRYRIEGMQEAKDAWGFTALPGGYRDKSGIYLDKGWAAYWWMKLPGNQVTGAALTMRLRSIQVYSYTKENGFSIRCVKNKEEY